MYCLIENVCTASQGNITYAAVHTPPSLCDTLSILEGEQVTALYREKGWKTSKIIIFKDHEKNI